MKNENEFELEDEKKQASKRFNVKKTLVISLVVVLVGWLGFSMFIGYPKERGINPTITVPRYLLESIDVFNVFEQEPKYPGLEAKIRRELIAVEQVTKRPDYLPEVMFRDLPDMPMDFYAKRVMYRYGLFEMDPELIGPEYWKQPEWYPKFEENTVKVLQNAPADRYGVCCFGIYPADAYMRLKIDGGEFHTFTKYAWIRSAPLVELYQGIRLAPHYPKEGNVEKDVTPWQENPKIDFMQDPDVAKKYIGISFAPEQFLLEPSFPIFRKEYIKLIEMQFTIDPDIPKGNYIVGFDTVAPDKEVSIDWMLKYPGAYNDARMGMFFSPRQYRLFITIV